jgi:outer membrane protein assembly factor BamE (lipoprotein component of BamABCDE complex)
MNKKPQILAALGVLALCITMLPSCSTGGAQFDTENIQRIEKGKTTKTDVVNYFGDPLRKESAPLGEVWTYTYVKSATTAAGVVTHIVGVEQSRTNVDKLVVIFDGDIVKDYDSSSSDHTDTYLQVGK